MIETWALTDVGLVRRDNQDAYGVYNEDPCTVCVVCDGMGGVHGGALASRIAVDTYLEVVRGEIRPNMSTFQMERLSARAVAEANNAIRRETERDPFLYGMGTTLVAALSCGENMAVVSNVGDSRAYHITESGIRRVTKDHSFVETLVDRGDITEEEARSHPKRNYITRALGPEPSILCDGFVVPLEPGEFLLLCSDGLVSTVSDLEMYTEIRGGDLDTCLERLLAISKQNGASDNVTAVLLRKL